jgi:hypothetical protein
MKKESTRFERTKESGTSEINLTEKPSCKGTHKLPPRTSDVAVEISQLDIKKKIILLKTFSTVSPVSGCSYMH